MGTCNGCMNKDYLKWRLGDPEMDRIEIKKLKLIGVGAFGRVWATTIEKYESEKQTFIEEGDEQTVYAIKEMNKCMILAKNAVGVANNEVKILQTIPKSPFIINLWHAFQDQTSAFLLMDYAPCGDLLFHMKNLKKQKNESFEKGGTFTEKQAKFLTTWILLGLKAIHDVGIVHRDIKPDNILMDSNGYPKLADFGIAEFESNLVGGSQYGTLSYMAPEIINGHSYSYTADYYSLGVLLLLMVTGDMLSVGETIEEAKKNIALRGDSLSTKRFVKRYPYLSEDWNDLIVQLLVTSQYQRLGAIKGVNEILDHPWFASIDLELIELQAFVSPIYSLVTSEININALTEISDHKMTQFWESKERKALKKISKTLVDKGDYWKSEFQEFIFVDVIEANSRGRERESMMTIRKHTMSSIRK